MDGEDTHTTRMSKRHMQHGLVLVCLYDAQDPTVTTVYEVFLIQKSHQPYKKKDTHNL